MIYLTGVPAQPYTVEVFDINGALVYRQLNMTNNRLNVSNLRAGMYVIVVNNRRCPLKLIKL